MSEQFARTKYSEQDASRVLSLQVGHEHIVYFEADRGPAFKSVRTRQTAKLRETYGRRPDGDLLFLAVERALDQGAALHMVRLLHLSDPTDIATVTAVAASANVGQNVGGAANEYIFSLNELGVGGNQFEVAIASGTDPNTFKVTLVDTSGTVSDEVYDNLSVDSDDPNYFLTVLNTNNPGRLRGTDSTPNASPTYPDELPANGTYPLIGGSNGTALNSASIIGDAAAGTGFHSAADALANPDVFSAHQFLDADPATIASGLAYAELASIFMWQGPPNFSDSEDARDFRRGIGIYSHAPFNSSFGALSYPAFEVFDVVAGMNVFVPPVSELPAMLGRAHDRNLGGAMWLAPAGKKRGGVSADVLGLSDDLGTAARLAEADDMVAADINLFVSRSGAIYHWANETLLLDDESLLRSMHVRYLLLYLRRILQSSFDNTLFDPNSVRTWKALSLKVIPALERLEAVDAFNNFGYFGDQDATKIDDPEQLTINDVADIANGIYRVKIAVQPFAAIDSEIGVIMEITSTGINFEEFYEAA